MKTKIEYEWLDYSKRSPFHVSGKRYWIWITGHDQPLIAFWSKEWGGFYKQGDYVQSRPCKHIGNFTDSRVTHWMEYFDPIEKP